MQTMPDILNGLERVNKIQMVLNQQITVLETLTPADFLTFRDLLTPASGNQSYQFRMIEIRLGLHAEPDISTAEFFKQLPEVDQAKLLQTKQLTSLYQAIEAWLTLYEKDAREYLTRYKHDVETKLTDRQEKLNRQPKNHIIDIQLEQFKTMRIACAEVLDETSYEKKREHGSCRLTYPSFLSALYLFLNQNHEELSDAFKLLKRLIELDELMALWRFHHALMVQRMIGHKLGTGGTTGYTHLRGDCRKRPHF